MATYPLPTGHQYLEARVNWSYTQNISANTSTVTAYVEARRTSSYMSTMDGTSPKLTFWIDGQERIQNVGYNFANYAVNTWFSIGSTVSATVGHNNDGTKSLNIATLYDTTVSNFGNLSKVQSVSLATIPRASVATNGWNWNAGADTIVSIERKSADYHHTVFFDVGFNNVYVGVAARSDVGTSVTSNFNQAEQALIAQKIVDYGNPSSIQSRIRVITYNSSNVQIGTEFQYGGLVNRPPESTISSQSSLELATTGVPYTLSGVYSSPWITHSLKLFSNSFNKTITLANGASTTGNITLTQTDIDALYALYTTQTYAPFNIEVTTLLAGVQLGAKRTITNGDGVLTFNPTAIAPNFTVTPTYSDVNTTITAITGNNQHIVQNKSNLRISIPATTGVPKYGATATTYAVAVNGVEKTATYSTSAVTIDFGLVNVGTNTTAQVSVIDSRGARTTKAINITVFPYSNPTIIGSAARANGFDNNTTVSATGTLSSVNAKNSVSAITYRYKLTTSGTWGSAIALTATTTNGSYATNAPVVSLDNSSMYNIEFSITDRFGGTATAAVFLDTGKPIMFVDKARKSVGIGKFPTNSGSFETAGNSYVGGDAYVSGNLTLTGTGGNVYTTSKKPTTADVGAAKALITANGYPGLAHNDGTTANWIRTTSDGLIPYADGGYSSSLGTVNWPFRDVHAQNMYLGGKNLAATTAINVSPNTGIWHYDDSSGGGFSYMKYWKTVDNIIHMQGTAYLESGYRGDFQTLFTLPVGYRPHAIVTFTVACSTGATRIDVNPNGNVGLRGNSLPDWVSLAGIAFYQAN